MKGLYNMSLDKTTLGTAGIIIIYVLPRTVNVIHYKWLSYSDKKMNQMEAIKSAYSEHCYSFENNTPYSTLKEGVENNNAPEKYPPFFIMHKDKEKSRLPNLYFEGFTPSTDASRWRNSIGNTTLSSEICNLISYICEYQVNRDKYISNFDSLMESNMEKWNSFKEYVNGGGPCFYDPINLFCEEMKNWLKNLATSPINDKTKEHIDHRINYLEAIYLNIEVFYQENSQGVFLNTVLYLCKYLEEKILSCVRLALSQEGAREHFKSITFTTKALLSDLVGFLFYIFKESKEVPSNFLIEQISKPTLETYKISIENTTGLFLQHLVNCSLLSKVYDINNRVQIISTDYYRFLDEKNNTYKIPGELFSDNVNTDNWYDKNSKKSGILDRFRKPELISSFLLLHGYIEKLSIFYLIGKKSYELSGDTGNLMLYGYASNGVVKTFENIEKLINEILKTLSFLINEGDELYADLVVNKSKKTNSLTNWAGISYRQAKGLHKNIKNSLSILQDKMGEVKNLSKKVNHPEYTKEVEEKAKELSEYMNMLTEHKIYSLSQNKNQLLDSGIEPSPQSVFHSPSRDTSKAISHTIQKEKQIAIVVQTSCEDLPLSEQANRNEASLRDSSPVTTTTTNTTWTTTTSTTAAASTGTTKSTINVTQKSQKVSSETNSESKKKSKKKNPLFGSINDKKEKKDTSSNEIDIKKNQEVENSAVKLFLGNGSEKKSLLKLKNLYHPDICHYLLHMTDNKAKCIRVIFADGDDWDNTTKFKTRLQNLIILTDKLKKPSVFISKGLGDNNNFICGIIKNSRLLFINPLGISEINNYYQTIIDFFKKEKINNDVWLSSNPIQKSNYKNAIISCSPIAVELAIHILSFSPEELENFWVKQLKTNELTHHDTSGLPYYVVNIDNLLPEALKILLDATSQETYSNQIMKIRKNHCEKLKIFPNKKSQDLGVSVEGYLTECKSKSPAQVVFNAFKGINNFSHIEDLKEFKLLEEELKLTASNSNEEDTKEFGNRTSLDKNYYPKISQRDKEFTSDQIEGTVGFIKKQGFVIGGVGLVGGGGLIFFGSIGLIVAIILSIIVLIYSCRRTAGTSVSTNNTSLEQKKVDALNLGDNKTSINHQQQTIVTSISPVYASPISQSPLNTSNNPYPTTTTTNTTWTTTTTTTAATTTSSMTTSKPS